MKSNYHTHTSYCDGKEPMPHFVERALQLHFKHLGFSSHAPINKENSFSIKEEKINEATSNFLPLINYLENLAVFFAFLPPSGSLLTPSTQPQPATTRLRAQGERYARRRYLRR